MLRQADMRMVFPQAEVEQIGQGIFLGLNFAALHHAQQLTHIRGHGRKAQRAQCSAVMRAVQRAYHHACTVFGTGDGVHGIGDMAKTVVPVSQHLKAALRSHCPAKHAAGLTVQCSQCRSAVGN